jgi:UPF0755 protein
VSKKLIAAWILVFLGVALFLLVFFKPNSNKVTIYLKTRDNADSLKAMLIRQNGVKHTLAFKIAANLLGLKRIYPGKYEVNAGMTNRELINMFKYGNQTEVSFRFGNNVFPFELYGALGRKFEKDSMDFYYAINDSSKYSALSLDPNSAMAMFWADTYQFPWTTTPERIVDYFINDQQKFWNSERFNKLSKTGLNSTREVYILATIIEKEAMDTAELSTIAGVYLNRLRIGMPLQADPTLKYASGIKFMQRVSGLLDIESPYNTYKNRGLPIGPIGLASKKGVDAVLNFKQHDYLYFCAKSDFSGTHNFTKSFAEHRINAQKYRAALDAKGVK